MRWPRWPSSHHPDFPTLAHSLTRSLTRSLAHSLTHPLTHPPAHPHSPTRSHSLTQVGGGLGGCSGREYRMGFGATKRCECVATPALTSSRGWYAACRVPRAAGRSLLSSPMHVCMHIHMGILGTRTHACIQVRCVPRAAPCRAGGAEATAARGEHATLQGHQVAVASEHACT